MMGQQLSPATVRTRQRQIEAVQLRAQGQSYEQIAAQLGYKSRSAAFKAVRAVVERTDSESKEELIRLHGERIQAGYRVVSELLTDPDTTPAVRLAAVDRLVRLLEREARMHGINAAPGVEVDGPQIVVHFDEALQFPSPPERDPAVVDALPNTNRTT